MPPIFQTAWEELVSPLFRRPFHEQVAALCYRGKGAEKEVLLITSRGTGRWILPKGWPMVGKNSAEAAAQEAWEEAGVKGKAFERCLGIYSYNKFIGLERGLPCVAMVYPVKVKSLEDSFPEQGQRRRKWFSLKKAAAKVAEPELSQILKTFDPKALKT